MRLAPEEFIRFITSIAVNARFDSCFISYASKDKRFVRRLDGDLRAAGVRCSLAPRDLRSVSMCGLPWARG
jgi:hypothetical protein